MIFENSKVYDVLKFIARYIGPIVIFLTAIINIWGIPYGEQIIATLAALEALLTKFVSMSKKKYNKMVDETFDAGKGDEEDVVELVEEQK